LCRYKEVSSEPFSRAEGKGFSALLVVIERSALSMKTLKDNHKTFLMFLLVLVPIICGLSDAALANSYSQQLQYGLKRGVKNILTSPLEIPLGFQEYHERSGWPFVRQGIGFIAGTGKMILRLGSGIVDLGAAWIPAWQKGLPPNPEELF
jgi:hypothetical protein